MCHWCHLQIHWSNGIFGLRFQIDFVCEKIKDWMSSILQIFCWSATKGVVHYSCWRQVLRMIPPNFKDRQLLFILLNMFCFQDMVCELQVTSLFSTWSRKLCWFPMSISSSLERHRARSYCQLCHRVETSRSEWKQAVYSWTTANCEVMPLVHQAQWSTVWSEVCFDIFCIPQVLACLNPWLCQCIAGKDMCFQREFTELGLGLNTGTRRMQTISQL